MRAGLVICGDLSFGSGGFLYDRMLVRALEEAGDTVEVISLPWDGFRQSLAVNLDHRLRERLLGWEGDLLLQDELAHPSLVLHNKALRHRGRFPIVSIVHHLRISEGGCAIARAARSPVERAYARGVDGFLFNSAATRQSVRALAGPGCEGLVVTPGGDRLGAGLTAEEAVRRAAEPGPLRVLFVGNIIPRKGLHTLVAALAAVPRGTWRLTVVGSPEMDRGYADRVRRDVGRCGLADSVDMRGPLDDAALAAALRSHHVLAVPSLYEGFGIVYLEAMGFAVVPVGTTAGGATEVIQDGESGRLVPPGDAPALAAALRDLCDDRARLAALAAGALRRFAGFPTWNQGMARARDHLHATAAEGTPR
jgi:glycosyltransferase involved in cell wall biosynthesis